MRSKDAKSGTKKILSLLLTVSMTAALAGCGGGSGQTGAGPDTEAGDHNSASGDADGQPQDKASGTGEEPVAMGRYVEEETDLSEMLPGDGNRGIYRRQDGSLVILNTQTQTEILVSKDEGVTWEAETAEWFAAMKEKEEYITDMAMAPDGTMLVIYDASENADEWMPTPKLILPDGTQVPVDVKLSEDEKYFSTLAALEDGRMLAGTLDDSLYEIHRDGSTEKIMTLPERLHWMTVQGDLLFMDNEYGTGEMPAIYDMTAGEYIEDEVLKEFTQENYGNRYYNGQSFRSMFLLPGEEQTVYLIGEKGIHRHVIGGNMMEQVVDGNLSMLSNPNYNINSAVRLSGDVFLVLFSNGRLVRFTYDADMPAVPENMLKIYSLKEDENIRQAIASFQSQNADLFVSYEIGMPEGGSVTREDAIKKLNTEVMAGTGPDLLVMDDLPLASYVEKGLLTDLTEYLEAYDAKEPLFDNVLDALKVDGRAYVAPATVGLPMVVGENKYVSNMTSLSDFADAVETLREEHPGEDITGISSAREMMRRFVSVSAPEWIVEGGGIDRQAIGEYLEQCRRIYDAQTEDLDQEILEYYQARDEALMSEYGMDLSEMEWEATHSLFELVGGSLHLINGWVKSAYTWITTTSIGRTEGFEDYSAVPMQGQGSGVFKPNTMLAISTASGQPDTAEMFMDFFLSEQVQCDYSGFPVNQGAFDLQFTPEEGSVSADGGYTYITVSNQEGLRVSYVGYWPTEEQLAALKEQLANLQTAYVMDSMLESAVFEQGAAYMQGDQTLEEALSKIEKKVAIYMAE